MRDEQKKGGGQWGSFLKPLKRKEIEAMGKAIPGPLQEIASGEPEPSEVTYINLAMSPEKKLRVEQMAQSIDRNMTAGRMILRLIDLKIQEMDEWEKGKEKEQEKET